MKLYNELKLRFDAPIWALYPELALFDAILEKKPELIQVVSNDVLEGVKDSVFGRKDSPTVEQVLRAAVYKEIKQLDYRTLETDMYDSKICSLFLKLNQGQVFSYSVMCKYISKITEANLRIIIQEINKIAISEKIETVNKISTDTTTVKTDIHYPTNNSLIYDCIKTATRLLKEQQFGEYSHLYKVKFW
jgi:IS5 family transposase